MYVGAYKCVHVVYVYFLCLFMFVVYSVHACVCCIVSVCCMCMHCMYVFSCTFVVYVRKYICAVCVPLCDSFAFFSIYTHEVKEKMCHYLWRIQPQIK